MVFLITVSFLSFFSLPSPFFFVITLILFWFYFQFNLSMFSNISLDFMFISDELSLFMVYMTAFVLFISYVSSIHLSLSVKVTMVYSFMLLFCFGVFTTNNLFFLYFYYECSLLPILYIIIKWGSYPERSLSAVMLLIYTSIFTFPFIMVMFSIYSLSGTMLLSNVFTFDYSSFNALSTFVVFCTFAVKLPVYGLHYWLPMAHVEAPTFGSMILAGVLLKLGGVGLIRCTNYISLEWLKSVILSYLMIFMIYVTLVCAFQSDFKRLVAYSSVSHMMAIPILYLSNNVLSLKSMLMLMLFHGLSSPILFMFVGILYSMYSTRQLILMRGLLLVSPLLSFLMVLAFFFTMSAPPFPSFVSEVYFMISSLSLSHHLVWVFLLFTFLSLVYNLNWLSSILFSSSTNNVMAYSLTYLNFLALTLSLLMSVPMIFLMMLM
uniref:NADH-ubiquinone oxidoreductase chain 4 n=1 Tax=Brachionus rotundiformis TaxID=96890 RepID=A0A1C9J9T6_9BILA|nr:NADH dehydrogenase subunit 4 [Brachionus rotundiformis]